MNIDDVRLTTKNARERLIKLEENLVLARIEEEVRDASSLGLYSTTICLCSRQFDSSKEKNFATLREQGFIIEELRDEINNLVIQGYYVVRWD